MKKLFKSFIPLLTLFSLLFSACEKHPLAEPVVTFKVDYFYDGEDLKPIRGKGDINKAVKWKEYKLVPVVDDLKICENGKWSYEVKTDPKKACYKVVNWDEKTGVLTFYHCSTGIINNTTPPAKYRVNFWYTCPDGTFYSGTILISTT